MTTRAALTTDELRAEIADLDDRMAELKSRRDAIVAELAKLPAGTYDTPAGGFTVRPPSRRFDLDRAFDSLPDYVQPLCLGPVAAKVKAQIPPAALDAFMTGGEGPNVVTIR